MKLSKKLVGNGLWESSRMMLPEHKEQIVLHEKRLGEKQRPDIDEQKWEEISSALRTSMEYRSEIVVVLFEKRQDRMMRGKVLWMDRIQLKIISECGTHWVDWRDIVDVYDPIVRED